MSSPQRPIYVIGRQHSGNTMLATMLGRHADAYAFAGEGTFFEHRASIEALEDPWPRIVQIVTEGADPPLGREAQEQFARQLRDEEMPDSAVDAYVRIKASVAAAMGATRWVQKATSYIFYVEAILEAFSEARLVFLLRNPLDLAASLKRRGQGRRFLRMVWGWNEGVRIARRWADDRRVLLLRYEDLVQRPEEQLREVCAFVNLPFNESLLEVPHVNRSETPYNQDGETTGLNESRVQYYQEVLTPEEEAVVRHWTEARHLQLTYPELPAARDARIGRTLVTTAWAVGQSLRTLAVDHGSALMENPGHVIDRIRRRI